MVAEPDVDGAQPAVDRVEPRVDRSRHGRAHAIALVDVADVMQRPSVPADDPMRWLVELRERLGPAIELLNERHEPILPAVRNDTAARLRRLVLPLRSAVQALLVSAHTSHEPAFATLGGLRLAAVGVHLGVHDGVGEPLTVLVGERVDAGREAPRRTELARVATWLSRALTRARLSASADPAREWRELSVLHRMLNDAIVQGSETDVVQAYVEALAIWADTDTRAYALDAAGRFVLDVALAGADAAAAPHLIAAASVDMTLGLTRLESDRAEGLGFPGPVDVVLGPVPADDGVRWLITYLSTSNSLDVDRLALFHDLLLPALRAAGELEASRLTWAMMQHLVHSPLSPRDAVANALEELEQAGLCTAAMLVLRRGGEVLLELGVPVPRTADGYDYLSPAVQHYALSVPDPFEASLTLWRPSTMPFTSRETRLGGIGASVLESWVATALDRGEIGVATEERRVERRRLGLDERPEVSLLVIRPDPARSSVNLREGWVSELKLRLRPADVIGALASGEIGVLLPNTEAGDAHLVAARLRHIFRQHSTLSALDRVPIGIATASSRWSDGYSLLKQARAHADAPADA